MQEATSISQFYDSINQRFDANGYGELLLFLNAGYVSDGSPRCARIEPPKYLPNQSSARLVFEVIGDCAMDDRDVLDVGCGRGGAVYLVNKFFAARRVVGLDICASSVAFCRQTHRLPATEFVVGSADAMPFGDGSFDVLIAIESAHHVSEARRLYAEAERVLKSGGCFLMGAIFPAAALNLHLDMMRSAGFTAEVVRDVTANVLLARADGAAREQQALGQDDAEEDQRFAFPGTDYFKKARGGEYVYFILRLRKTDAGELAHASTPVKARGNQPSAAEVLRRAERQKEFMDRRKAARRREGEG